MINIYPKIINFLMKFTKVKVKTSTEVNFPSNDANGRIESLNINKSIIWLLVILISLNSAFLYMSPVILNNCKNQIKFELKLSIQSFDLLRSFNNLGALLGAIIFTLVIEKVNHKVILISFLLINCLCHFSFYLKLSFLALLISRFISGIVSTFCFIYFPFWVDKFGINNWITFMQGLVQISKIFGISLGFSLFSILGNRKWNYAFFIESILVTLVTFLMYLLPNDYFDKRYLDMERENTFDEKVEKETILKDVVLNIPFILLQLYRGKILFINQVINFLQNKKIESAIFSNEKNFLNQSYLFNTIFSSFLGIVSGSLIHTIVGGQKGKYNFLVIFYLQLIACFLLFLSNKYNSIVFFNIMICTSNYFNAACGIISLNTSFAIMPKTLKGISSGILNIIIISLGILPAFKGYNLINNFVGDSGIINVLMLYGMVGCFELICADFYMKINKSKLYQKF